MPTELQLCTELGTRFPVASHACYQIWVCSIAEQQGNWVTSRRKGIPKLERALGTFEYAFRQGTIGNDCRDRTTGTLLGCKKKTENNQDFMIWVTVLTLYHLSSTEISATSHVNQREQRCAVAEVGARPGGDTALKSGVSILRHQGGNAALTFLQKQSLMEDSGPSIPAAGLLLRVANTFISCLSFPQGTPITQPSAVLTV